MKPRLYSTKTGVNIPQARWESAQQNWSEILHEARLFAQQNSLDARREPAQQKLERDSLRIYSINTGENPPQAHQRIHSTETGMRR